MASCDQRQLWWFLEDTYRRKKTSHSIRWRKQVKSKYAIVAWICHGGINFNGQSYFQTPILAASLCTCEFVLLVMVSVLCKIEAISPLWIANHVQHKWRGVFLEVEGTSVVQWSGVLSCQCRLILFGNLKMIVIPFIFNHSVRLLCCESDIWFEWMDGETRISITSEIIEDNDAGSETTVPYQDVVGDWDKIINCTEVIK